MTERKKPALAAKTWTATRIEVDEKRLRLVTEEVLSESLGRAVVVKNLERQASKFATLFPADILTVCLEGGEKLSLFLKHLGMEEADHPDKLGPTRETRIYEDLLQAEGLPVVRYFGTRHNAATGRHELFLEFVDDWTLQYQELDYWFLAARRLARFHAHFSQRPAQLEACEVLMQLDAEYLASWAERANEAMSLHGKKEVAQLRALLMDYPAVVEILTTQPTTLVHNEPSAKNVIADRSYQPARICFIDWEMAGIGCGLLDLAHLKYGLEPADDDKMVKAYLQELPEDLRSTYDPATARRVLAACDAHKSLYRLAHCQAWQLSAAQVRQFLSETENSVKEAVKKT